MSADQSHSCQIEQSCAHIEICLPVFVFNCTNKNFMVESMKIILNGEAFYEHR